MAIKPHLAVDCDFCGAALKPHEGHPPNDDEDDPRGVLFSDDKTFATFENERQATRAAKRAGWYIDGVRWTDAKGEVHLGKIRCPNHWPGHEHTPTPTEEPTP